MSSSRRKFLRHTSAWTLGFAGLQKFSVGDLTAAPGTTGGYGPLVKDPNKILDLPKGFQARIISRAGETMTDGFIAPGAPDGMAAFPGKGGRTVIVRNHEISPEADPKTGAFGPKNELVSKLKDSQLYDAGPRNNPNLGGTSTLIYDTNTGKLERSFLSLAGTLRNCAGGPTPWNSWITCEETVVTRGLHCLHDHGFNFEVPATDQPSLANPIPLKDMGRFNHEAIAVEPKSGIVYQTEDRPDGLIYRFIPNVPGKLAQGGRLQALAVANRRSFDTRNWNRQIVDVGRQLDVKWIDMKDVASKSDMLRYRGSTDGAATFARGEGMWYADGVIYFACTNGGQAKCGQIWKYHPSPTEGTSAESKQPGRLELFVEPNDPTLVDNADNLTVAPNGDLIVCEDGKGEQNLVGVTPNGELFRFGHNAYNNSEFAGACFSPDGSTMFVNIQRPGYTLAITGPWKRG